MTEHSEQQQKEKQTETRPVEKTGRVCNIPKDQLFKISPHGKKSKKMVGFRLTLDEEKFLNDLIARKAARGHTETVESIFRKMLNHYREAPWTVFTF